MVRSSGFGSIRSDRGRPIQTCFRSGFRCFSSLTKPLPISRQSILPKVRSQVLQLSYRLYAHGFMFYFTPRQGFSFTFPSRYLFAIGHSGVFSLTRWSSLIHTGFHVSHATRDKQKVLWIFGLLDFHHLWCRFQLLRLNSHEFFYKNVFPRPQIKNLV